MRDKGFGAITFVISFGKGAEIYTPDYRVKNAEIARKYDIVYYFCSQGHFV